MKKIMFNETFGLQQATFQGNKTMTRRIVPQVILDYAPKYQQEYYEQTLSSISLEDAILNMVGAEKMFQRYVYNVGEVVAIAQNYEQARPDMNEQQRDDLIYANMKHLFYRKKKLPGFKNKMFVKAELMPHKIVILQRKLERLQDISDEDCLKEGIQVIKGGFRNQDAYTFKCDKVWFRTPRRAFAALIDKLSGKGTWESNPLVFAYDYSLL